MQTTRCSGQHALWLLSLLVCSPSRAHIQVHSCNERPASASRREQAGALTPGGRAQGKTNFFERRVGEYQRAGVMAGMRPGRAGGERASDYTFTTDEDF